MNGLNRYWLALLGAAILPIAVAAVIAFSPLGGEAMLVPLLIAGGIASTGVALAAFMISRKLSKLASACEKLAGPDSLLGASDEFDCIARTLIAMDAKQKSSVADHEKSVTDLTAVIARIGEGTTNVDHPLPAVSSECAQALAASVREAAKKVNTLKQRQATSSKILAEYPTPLLAIDDAGSVRYANGAFERLLGKGSLQRKDFSSLLSNSEGGFDALGHTILDAATFKQWTKKGGQGEAVLEFKGTEDETIPVSVRGLRLSNSTEGVWYLAARDLRDDYRRASMDRAETREQTLRAIWDSTTRVSTESIDTILAATRLLTSDAKQATDRDTMLTRATALRQHAGGLEGYLRTIRWLNMALWGELPKALVSEFQANEPVKAAVDQIMPRFKNRSVTVNIVDNGGWVVADEEWLRTALLGILFHAAESVNESTVGVHLKRLPPLPDTTEERVCFEVLDAGPTLTQAQQSDLESLFGGLTTPSFLNADATGYMPGLILAAELARKMDGTLEFDATPSGGLIVRFVLPTRIITETLAEPTPEPTEFGAIEELVMGWKLGVA